jgi:hypothetical protein
MDWPSKIVNPLGSELLPALPSMFGTSDEQGYLKVSWIGPAKLSLPYMWSSVQLTLAVIQIRYCFRAIDMRDARSGPTLRRKCLNSSSSFHLKELS